MHLAGQVARRAEAVERDETIIVGAVLRRHIVVHCGGGAERGKLGGFGDGGKGIGGTIDGYTGCIRIAAARPGQMDLASCLRKPGEICYWSGFTGV